MAVERKRLPIPVHENGASGVREAEKEAFVHENGPSGVRDRNGDKEAHKKQGRPEGSALYTGATPGLEGGGDADEVFGLECGATDEAAVDVLLGEELLVVGGLEGAAV